MLPQDIEDRTVYTILAKPVPRFEYVLGKLGGVLLLLALTTVIMAALFLAVLAFREQMALAATARQMAGLPQEQIAEALRAIRASTFNADLFPGISVIFLKACLLASLTLFISTFATSNIFTVVVTVFVYFIGHLQGPAREFWLQEHSAGWASRTFLGMVALLFPDLQLFNLADEVVIGAAIPLAIFLKTAALGFFFTLIYLLLAIAVFNAKEL
jgi:hypothetical protein